MLWWACWRLVLWYLIAGGGGPPPEDRLEPGPPHRIEIVGELEGGPAPQQEATVDLAPCFITPCRTQQIPGHHVADQLHREHRVAGGGPLYLGRKDQPYEDATHRSCTADWRGAMGLKNPSKIPFRSWVPRKPEPLGAELNTWC